MSILSQAKKILKRQEAKPKQAAKPKKTAAAAAAQPASLSLVSAGTIGLSLILSEKSMLEQAGNVLVVRVKPQASKPQIAQAVEQLFSVRVLSVRTSRLHPKKRQRGVTAGRTSHWKKAYVKVDDISKLNVSA